MWEYRVSDTERTVFTFDLALEPLHFPSRL